MLENPGIDQGALRNARGTQQRDLFEVLIPGLGAVDALAPVLGNPVRFGLLVGLLRVLLAGFGDLPICQGFDVVAVFLEIVDFRLLAGRCSTWNGRRRWLICNRTGTICNLGGGPGSQRIALRFGFPQLACEFLNAWDIARAGFLLRGAVFVGRFDEFAGFVAVPWRSPTVFLGLAFRIGLRALVDGAEFGFVLG